MKLKHLRLENYRGYNRAAEIPLDGRVLLFYGQNGRGKSSVFGALELALFPLEKGRELRREYGTDEVALTNRFNEAPEGSVKLLIEEDGAEEVVEQKVCDDLRQMKPESRPLHRKLAGHRRRIFFTQELLRDLMLGSPAVRYSRLSEMLGTNAYDPLIDGLRRWVAASGRGLQVREQMQSLSRLDENWARIHKVLKDVGLEHVMPGLMQQQWQPDAGRWLLQSVFETWKARDAELAAYVGQRANLEVPDAGEAATAARFALAELWSHFDFGYYPLDSLPLAPWRDHLLKLYAEVFAAEAEHKTLSDALVRGVAEPKLREVMEAIPSAKQRMDEARTAWNTTRDNYEGLARLATEQATAVMDVLPRLAESFARARAMTKWFTFDAVQLRLLVKRRRRLLHGIRYFYDALASLTHEELDRRGQMLRPVWTQYYGQISSHAHFQDVDLEVRQLLEDEDPLTTYWASPFRVRTVRFLVSDSQAKKKAQTGLPMQALLSEGQLNCAVVALAMALAEMQPPPLKLIALDDPFVSWDDVNMENFLAALRNLAREKWMVILSACDERVVTRFRRNMETLGADVPGMIYTFRDWDRERGPQVELTRLSQTQTKHLKDLDLDVCAFEPIQWEAEAMEDVNHEADVWIVPLSDQPLQPGHELRFKDIPYKLQRYYYPASWPRRLNTPYIGFRYDGRLQAIARIVTRRSIPNFDQEIPGLTTAWAAKPHIVLELADLQPWPTELKSGRIWDRHAYCDLDLLKNSATIMEADRLSAERRRHKGKIAPSNQA